MKNYIFTRNRALLVLDDEKNKDLKIDLIYSAYPSIDYMYLIPEDGIFNFEGVKYEVHKYDIVYILYNMDKVSQDGYIREIAIVSNEQLYNYYNCKQSNNAASNTIDPPLKCVADEDTSETPKSVTTNIVYDSEEMTPDCSDR